MNELERDSLTVTLSADEQSADTPMMGCRSCGAMQPSGFRFCRVCGAPFTRGDQPDGYLDPLVGAIVGERYRILARIGSGGMGAVYRVEHVQIGKVAAMKLLHGELSRDQEMVRRFNREARAVSRLTSPHTVSVFDFGRSAGLVYIVMELLTGQDLSQVLRDETRLAPVRVATIVSQVAEALAEAHALGIVHRDLKPQNIFLVDGPGGTDFVKVLDFGLAKLAEGREESLSGRMTQAGVVLGTPHYMSPEQIADRHVDPRSDIYSLGAVAYRLLTGVPPFQHSTALGVLHMHLNEPVPALADSDPALAPLDRVIRRAMAKRPQDRYASVRELASDFARAARASGSDEGSRPGRLTAEIGVPDAARIGTRQEFEIFERHLRLRRAFSVFAAVMIAAVGAVSAYLFATSDLRPARGQELEPNDDPRTATLVRPGVPVRGAIVPRPASGTDTDVFRVPVGSGGMVMAVTVTPAHGADLIVEVVDDTGHTLVRSDSGGPAEAERVPNLTTAGGDLFVVVRGRAGEHVDGSYTFDVRLRDRFDAEEAEPNETAPQAPSERVVGMIGWSGDRDSHWLTGGAAGGRYRVSVTGVPGVDLRIELSDRQRTAVRVTDEAGVGDGESVTLDVAASDFVGTPILTISAAPGQHSHLVYELRVVAERGPRSTE